MTEQATEAGSTPTDTSISDTSVTDGAQVAGDAGNPADLGGMTPSPEAQAPAVPETYAFEAPEGGEIDTDLINAVSPVMKELGLTQEQAGKLFSAYTDAVNQGANAEVANAHTKWEAELKNDPEFGGDNFDRNAAQVSQFVASTMPAESRGEFFEMLDSTGLGSNPAFVKYMFNLSKQFPTGEDSPNGGGSSMGGGKSTEQRMYGTD